MKNIFAIVLLLSTLTACGGSGADSVSGSSQNQAPVANAGIGQNVVTTSVVILDASASSDSDGDTLFYSWSLTSLPENSGASLTNSTGASPTFTTDIDGSYVAQLIVNDGTENSVADTVTIVATTANSVPVAEAGTDQNVVTTTIVTLDASASSDSDGDTLSYSWSLTSLPENSSASLSDSSSAVPTFTVDLDGTYVTQLIVNDGIEDSVADTVIIVAETANSIPVANAGNDQNVVTTSVVTLDASASSDSDGDTLAYSWSLTSLPENSSASLSDSSSAVPTFMVDLDGTYVAQLIVNDGTEDSVADTITIIAATANSIPVANAGIDQNILAGNMVSLDASGSSDADGDLLSYTWSFVSKPTGSSSVLDNEQAETPSFTPDLDGSYVFSLIVNDGLEDSISDNVTIEAIQPKVRLYKDSGSFFGGTFNEVSLPYSSNGTVTASVSGIPIPTTYSLDTFKLLAEGQNFTVINVTVTDNTTQVTPYFTVISDDYELVDGTEVEFELISPLTRGATVTLHFSFEIQETGDTFSSSYTFTSN
ncbi:MAG: PKD domain-containing protein [Cognaticolwellia sp.]